MPRIKFNRYKMIEDNNPAFKWKLLADSDQITMFIKTWFSFIASIKSIMKFDKEELKEEDKIVLKKYKEATARMIEEGIIVRGYEGDMFAEMNMFKISLDLLPKEIPFCCFPLFFEIDNKHVNQIAYDNKLYKSHITIKNLDKNNLAINVFVREKCSSVNTNLTFDYPKERINELFNNYFSTKNSRHNQFYDLVYGDIYHFIDNEVKKQQIENCKIVDLIKKMNGRLLEKTIRTIDSKYREFFKNRKLKEPLNETLLKARPFVCFDDFEEYDAFLFYSNFKQLGGKFIIWQIDLVYAIRNFLFHGIIDPFDEKWQTLLKNTCEALRKLVDFNTKMFSSFIRKKNMF